MQAMAAGGMGGGVAAAVARAIGAGKQEEADRVAAQALLIALGVAGLLHGRVPRARAVAVRRDRGLRGRAPRQDRLLERPVPRRGRAVALPPAGGGGPRLRRHGLPSTVLIIVTQLLRRAVPARSPFGVGPGARARRARRGALSSVLSFVPGVVALGVHRQSPAAPARLSARNLRLQPAILWEICQVGLPSLNNILTNANGDPGRPRFDRGNRGDRGLRRRVPDRVRDRAARLRPGRGDPRAGGRRERQWRSPAGAAHPRGSARP